TTLWGKRGERGAITDRAWGGHGYGRCCASHAHGEIHPRVAYTRGARPTRARDPTMVGGAICDRPSSRGPGRRRVGRAELCRGGVADRRRSARGDRGGRDRHVITRGLRA